MAPESRYYRAPQSVSIASALSTALTIYPCQIQVHQRWQSKLQLPTAQKEWWPATADSLPQAVTCQHCDTHYVAGIEPTTFRLLVRHATSSATDSHEYKFSFVWQVHFKAPTVCHIPFARCLVYLCHSPSKCVLLTVCLLTCIFQWCQLSKAVIFDPPGSVPTDVLFSTKCQLKLQTWCGGDMSHSPLHTSSPSTGWPLYRAHELHWLVQ